MVLRWTSTVNFNISKGISPTGVALEPSECKISFLTWSSVTSSKENSLLLSLSYSFLHLDDIETSKIHYPKL